MTERAKLIERLEKAEAGSRELDCWIGYHADLLVDDMSWREKIDKFGIEHALNAATSYSNVWRTQLPHYSTSIDAAVALVERLLPGWTIASIGQDDGKRWHAELRKGYRTSYSTVALAGSPTPALALCLAALKALEARDKPTI